MDVATATSFPVKIGEIGIFTFIHGLGIPKRSGVSQFQFQTVHLDNRATSCKHLVNCGAVTSEYKSHLLRKRFLNRSNSFYAIDNIRWN